MPVSGKQSYFGDGGSGCSIQEISRLIGELDSLTEGEGASARLVQCGPSAIPPLRAFLLEGRPRKIFQPRLRAVKALARLGAKDILVEYLFLTKSIADPEDRFGEETVRSAAARSLSAWPDDDTYRSLLKLSESQTLIGLIEALAEYHRPEAMPYFERALEDDYYRSAAKDAFMKLGEDSRETLVRSAVTPQPDSSCETPSSLRRRRTAVGILSEIGIRAEDWLILRRLIQESDAELVVVASKLGTAFAVKKDRVMMIRRLGRLVSLVPWYLQEDIEGVLTALRVAPDRIRKMKSRDQQAVRKRI